MRKYIMTESFETFKDNSSDKLSSKSVESEANYEGNDSVLFFGRLEDPLIREQLIDLLYKSEFEEHEKIMNLVFTPYELPGHPELKCFKDQYDVVYASSDHNYNPKDRQAPSRKDAEKQFDEQLEKAKSKTEIDFTDKQSNQECMRPNWKLPWSEQKATNKQLSIIEAHEKGHVIRSYDNLRKYFSVGFDPTKMIFTEKDLEIQANLAKEETENQDFSAEALKEGVVRYLFSGNEIAERMSQLKNYFGIKNSEPFTKDYLDYAREHYISDTGMDNHMGHFFQAITPDTESAFLELMNSSGI